MQGEPITYQTFKILTEKFKTKCKTLIKFLRNFLDLIFIAPKWSISHFYRKTAFVKLHYLMSL